MATTAPSEAPQTFDPQAFDRDEADTIFLLTSLTSGSSSIITATSRLEHILKSNKVTFKAVDLATDDKARRLWQWKGKGKRLPGVAKNGEVLGNFEDIEEWNEYGELRQNLGLAKRKKKKINVMDGDTARPKPSRTATPNVVEPKPPKSDLPAGGVPTAIAQAAAAAGKKKAAGIKSAVERAEGKKRSSKPKAEKSTEEKAEKVAAEPKAEKKDDTVAEEKKEPKPEAEKKEETVTPAPEVEKKGEAAPAEEKKEEPEHKKEEEKKEEEKKEEGPAPVVNDIEEATVSEIKASVEKLDLQDEKEPLVAGDEESKTPTQMPAEKAEN